MILSLFYILIVAIAIIVALYFVAILYQKNNIPVNPVIAGPTSNYHPVTNNSTTISPIFNAYYFNGKKVNPKDYTICKIDGDCMGIRGIKANDIVFIKEFKNKEDRRNLKKGDVAYIKYVKNNFEGYKLREIADFLMDDNAVKTIYYTTEGEIKYSSEPHQIDNIVGVVAMKFSN